MMVFDLEAFTSGNIFQEILFAPYLHILDLLAVIADQMVVVLAFQLRGQAPGLKVDMLQFATLDHFLDLAINGRLVWP
jgi:hypothetical protein